MSGSVKDRKVKAAVGGQRGGHVTGVRGVDVRRARTL